MRAILLIILSSAVSNAMANPRESCDRLVASKFLDPIAVERRTVYVDKFRRAGFENPRDRVWERTMTDRRPFWIASDPNEGQVVQAFALARHFDLEYYPVVVSDQTNFFDLFLQVKAVADNSKGVFVWIAVEPGSSLQNIDAHLFIDGICELMLQGKLVLVIEERSETSFDNELPAHFIQPAA